MSNYNPFYEYPIYIPVAYCCVHCYRTPLFCPIPCPYKKNALKIKEKNYNDIDTLPICNTSKFLELLLTTSDPKITKDVVKFKSTFNLDDRQIKKLKLKVLEQRNLILDEERKIRENLRPPYGFDTDIKTIYSSTDNSIKHILKDDYEPVTTWLIRWAESFKEYMKRVRSTIEKDDVHFVFATHCNGACSPKVAVFPDICLDFANTNNVFPSEWAKYKEMYNSPPPKHHIDIWSSLTGKKVPNVLVRGGLNYNNDDYYHGSQCRRLFSNLPKGMPGAEQEYFECKMPYPNGLDLGKDIAHELGLKEGENATVFIDCSKLPKCPANEIRPTLRRGSKGKYVEIIQKILSNLGYDLGSSGIDGDYGYYTERAVMKFQSDNGLNPDGVVGVKTWPIFIQYENRE